MPRKTSRSIRDDLPTQAAVFEAGTSFNAQRWNEPGYASIEAGIAALGLAHQQFIKRTDVFKLVNNDPRLAVMLTLVWGYRDGTINGHRPPVEAVFRNAETIANALQKLRQQGEPLPAGVLIGELNALCGTGISTSTTSKLAYFFEL